MFLPKDIITAIYCGLANHVKFFLNSFNEISTMSADVLAP